MDLAALHDAIDHVPLTLAVVGLASMLLGQIGGRRGPWLYGAVSLSLAAVAAIVAHVVGVSAAGGTTPTLIAGAVSARLLATILMVLAGLASVVAWRRLVRFPRELRMPGLLRTILLLSALLGTAALGYASAVR